MDNNQLLKEVCVLWSFSASLCSDAWAVKYLKCLIDNRLFGF
jgi:hypothetical protein